MGGRGAVRENRHIEKDLTREIPPGAEAEKRKHSRSLSCVGLEQTAEKEEIKTE